MALVNLDKAAWWKLGKGALINLAGFAALALSTTVIPAIDGDTLTGSAMLGAANMVVAMIYQFTRSQPAQ